jgi:hypothetical protein
VVTGLDRGQIESGQGTARADLRSAIGFLGDVRAALGDAAPAIEEVHVDPVLGLSFAVAGESARVLAGKAPWRDRIAQWARVRDELKKRGLQAEAVTFAGERRPERVVARLAVVKPETK